MTESIVDYVILGLFSEIYGIPLARILHRIGYGPKVWAIALIPGINLLAYLFVSFGRWPIPDASAYRYRRI